MKLVRRNLNPELLEQVASPASPGACTRAITEQVDCIRRARENLDIEGRSPQSLESKVRELEV